MTVKKDLYKLLSKKVIKSLNDRQMEGYYVDNKEEAVKKVLELIQDKSSVGWGGTMTAVEIGLIDALKNSEHTLIDRSKAKTPEEAVEIMNETMKADYFLMSSNAITYDGQLINVDGAGNRVAALIWGPKNIIVIAGINKLVKDEECALKRAREVASPMNNMRFQTGNPCTIDGDCHNCKSTKCTCCTIVTTRFSRIKNRIKVVIVGEELGY